MIVAINVLEISFIILLLFMLGLSGVIGLVVITRMVEPRGVKALSQRLTGFPRPKESRKS